MNKVSNETEINFYIYVASYFVVLKVIHTTQKIFTMYNIKYSL
jgi:hypothetical protein